MNAKNSQELLVRGLAVVGFIALLFVGLWGTVQIVRGLPNVFSGLASVATSISSVFVPAERLAVTVPASVDSGEAFTVSWDHTNPRGDGVYTISFACREGVTAESPDRNGTYSEVFCNTPFNFTDAEREVRLVFSSTKNRFVDVPITVAYEEPGSDEPGTLADSALVTVVNTDIPTGSDSGNGSGDNGSGTGGGTARTPGTRTDTTRVISGGGAVSNPSGRPDLTARVLAVGYINDNNVFVASSTPSINKQIAVRFTIENVGDKNTGSWTFNTVLPTMPAHIFHSDIQQNLGPGDRIEYTIAWNKTENKKDARFVINADPTRRVQESNENNNIITHNFTVGGTSQ